MKILVINGPNLNMLGIREPDLYGTGTYDALCEKIEVYCATKGVAVSFYQSNHEGALVDRIQEAYYEGVDGIVLDWATDSAYWALYEGDAYATASAAGIVLVDGGVYKLVYEKF